MRAALLLSELSRRGVRLEAAGDRLRFDAPKGVLTPELRREMVEHKAELLELVERHGRRHPVDLVGVAELLVAGQLAGWPRLRIAPHMTLLAGEDAWLKFVDHPPAGALAAALEAINLYGEEERSS